MRRLTSAFVVLAAFEMAATPVRAGHTPTQVPYHGNLELNGSPVDGTEDLTFFVVATPADGLGAALWQETHVAVPVSTGLFSVILGDVVPFPDGLFAQEALYIGVQVGTTVLEGRQRLLPVPYAVETQSIPAGTLMPYAGATAPSGWLLCAGQLLAVATYQHLFDVIGYTYGGSVLNFNLPDLRGRVIVGRDNMGGTSANRVTASQADILGDSAGRESTTDIPAHTHSTPEHRHGILSACSSTSCGDGYDGFTRGNQNLDSSAFQTLPDSGGGTSGSTGAASTVNTMPPYMTANYMIKI